MSSSCEGPKSTTSRVLIDKLIKDQILDGPDLLVILPEESSDFYVPVYSINVGPLKSIAKGL
jgi:hypothetical protein